MTDTLIIRNAARAAWFKDYNTSNPWNPETEPEAYTIWDMEFKSIGAK